jgi:histidine triad (HIT) family protein
MSDPNCVFCKIVAGQIPAMRVYEDVDTLAFLDIGPLAEGHMLVMPKQHFERLDEMDGELVGRITATLPKLGRSVMQVTSAAGFNVLQNNGKAAGQEVPHVHFHIIPRVPADGLGYRWLKSSYQAGRAEIVKEQLLEALRG